jgi:hypothetical protein
MHDPETWHSVFRKECAQTNALSCEGPNEIPCSNLTGNIPSCRHYTTLEVSHRRHLCIGSVVHLHARAGIIDAERLRVNLDAYKPIARLFGNLYARLGEKFVLKRQSFTEWEAENGVDAAADCAETKS